MSGNAARAQRSRCMKFISCILDCCTCCTPGCRKCLPCNLDCCTKQDETGALLGNDNGRLRTTSQSTAICQQPAPRGNISDDRTTQRTENSPEPPQTMSDNNDEQREETPQETKSNQDSPEESAAEDVGRWRFPCSDVSVDSHGSADGGEFSSSFEDKLEQMRGVIKKSPNKKVKVGIFSRAVESEFEWLKTKLESQSFVKSVQPYYISNSGMPEFSSGESRCDFGILYHTKNRGRVNLTDVTDSLYDEELEEMSLTLEKKNVIVVIDDLTDSSEERKKEILRDQPKLGTLATDVFLFSEDEK
ncbi:uncharacterized protein [Ranitomeya imitator]|uniref:uncharacterized protein isoform X1 n=1 Tax=Ranitomeya imitator TaxID=111125 RepID=UPI0037E894F3